MSKLKPAPWRHDRNITLEQSFIRSADHDLVASVPEEVDAQAITALPELLSVMCRMRSQLKFAGVVNPDVMIEMDRVLKKAGIE